MTPFRRFAIGVAAAAALSAAGCMAGPTYTRPPESAPPMFKEEPPPGSTLDAEWRQARPADDTIRRSWWDAFQDPALADLEKQVESSNLTVAEAEARFRAARAAVRGSRAGLFPTVTGGATFNVVRVSPNRSATQRGFATGRAVDYQLPFDLSYEADLWGRIRRDVEASATTAQASAADAQTALLSSQAELALDYFAMRSAEAQQQLLETTVAAYERALQLTEARHEQGVVSGTDVAQAQTQLETARTQEVDVAIARAQNEHAIAILIGQAPSELALPATAQMLAPPVVPIALPSELLERRPDIAAAERRTASANADIGVAAAAYFPALTLTASGGFESAVVGTLLSWPSRFWSIGPALVQTVFDGGRRRSVKEQAVATYEETVATYKMSVLTAFQEVEDNLAALRVLADEAILAGNATAAAKRSLDLATVRYTQGVGTYLDVITAQTAALVNERAEIDIATRRLTASVLLIKALGGGWTTADLPTVAAVSE